MGSTRRKIGEIFVNNNIITRTTLARALKRAKRLNKKLGFVLEDMEVVTDRELANALAFQYGYKVVKNFAHHSFPASLLEILPVDVSTQHLLFPLKTANGKLFLAMADPTDTKIVSNIAANHRLTIHPLIATRSDIIDAINKHYLGKGPEESVEKKSVLVAEDNKLIYSALRSSLQQAGYRVIVATDGMEAYKQALAERPHVILTDKEMPKLDGYGLLNALKNLPETKDIPIILITAHDKGTEEANAFEYGFFDFLAKPIKEPSLLARVGRAFQLIEAATPEASSDSE